MSESHNIIFPGATFPTMEEARTAVVTWTVARGESLKVFCGNKLRTDYRCLSGAACPFRVYVSRESHNGDTNYKVRQVTHHSCPPVTHVGFSGNNSQRYLQSKLEGIVADERTIRPRTLQTIERRERNSHANYQAMLRCRNQVRQSLEGDDQAQIRLIQPFLRAISDSGSAIVSFSRDEDHEFRHAFIIPNAAINAYLHSPQLLCMDACHFKNAMPGHILGASFLDGANRITNLAFGVATTNECKEVWLEFLGCLKQAFHQHSHYLNPGAIGDRGKGLVPAFEEIFPSGHLYHCTQHLAENIRTRFNAEIESMFRRLPYLQDANGFNESVNRITQTMPHGPEATDYIRNIDPKLWTTFAAPVDQFPRYGAKTSNAIESVWGKHLEERKMTYFGFIYTTWNENMLLYPRRLQDTERNKHPRFVDFLYGIFARENEKSRKFLVFPASGTKALVSASQAVGAGYAVDIERHTCSCLSWQDRWSPCQHALAFLNFLHLDAEQYIDNCYRIETYKEAYSGELAVVASNLLVADDTLPPGGAQEAQPRGRGRPSTRKRGHKRTRDQEDRRMEQLALQRSLLEEAEAAQGAVVIGPRERLEFEEEARIRRNARRQPSV